MSDPTQIVLTGGFAAIAVLFTMGALSRLLSRRKNLDAQMPCTIPCVEGATSPDDMPARVAVPPDLPVGKVPVWFYHPLDLFGAAFILLVFGGLVIASFGAEEATTSINPAVLAANIAFQFILAGAIVTLVFWRVNVVTWLGLRWPNWQWVLLIAPCTVFSMWMLFGALQLSGYMKWMESLGVETVQDTVKLLQESKDPLVIGLMAIAAVIAAPICEEIIFRGYLYPVLKRFAGVWPAAICSAFVFSAAHGNLTALLPLFVFGALLVLIYEKTGSLWAPIAVHFCFNGATVMLQLAARYLHIPLDSAP
jgi:membrane protease YdiL (CAAX protease family)